MAENHPGHESLAHVHRYAPNVAEIELIPPHDPREETPEYRKTHEMMTLHWDLPCAICRVRHSTLADPAKNPYGARQMETHHRYIMRSFADACDPNKVREGLFAESVRDQASLLEWVDSYKNMLVLCDVHHRSTRYGIHHIPMEVFLAQKFFLDGYIAVAHTPEEAEACAAADDALLKKRAAEPNP